MKLEQYKENMSSACDYILESADEKLKCEERKSNLIASDAGPMYYQSWILANISGDRFERFWVAMENDILYLCRKPTNVPSNYEDVVVAYVQLRHSTRITSWNATYHCQPSSPQRKNTRNLSMMSNISSTSSCGEDEDGAWGRADSPSSLLDVETPSPKSFLNSEEMTSLLAPVRCSNIPAQKKKSAPNVVNTQTLQNTGTHFVRYEENSTLSW